MPLSRRASPCAKRASCFRERTLKQLESQAVTAGGRVTDGHIGKTIDGIGDTTVAMLEDAGLTTYMDLAYADPIRVMASMGHPLRLVLAWIDQCLLAVYAPALKGPLARAGVPCALDAAAFFEAHCYDVKAATPKDWKNDPSMNELAKAVAVAPDLLFDILQGVHDDPHVRFLAEIWDTNATEVEG